VSREVTQERFAGFLAFLRDFAGAQVVHFAGHFIANRLSPANSKLLFADGDLRSSELGAYKLPRSKLVVLSACETGVERYDRSEGPSASRARSSRSALPSSSRASGRLTRNRRRT
jgi:CHAT domain-containing protein